MKSNKKKWVKRGIFIAIILAVGAFLVYSAMNSRAEQYTEETVKTRDIETFYTFSGNIEPNKAQTVYATAPGKVNRVNFLRDDAVKEDDNILRTQSGIQVKAPQDGIIADIFAEADESFQAGDALFRVATFDNPVVIISVDEYDVHALKAGDAVTVYIQAMDKTVKGTIEKIDREATVAGNVAFYKAKVQIEQDGTILMGMTCEVAAPKQNAVGVATLPLTSLYFDEDNNPYVLIRDRRDEVVAEYVTLGVNNGSIVEILDGVRSGDTVLTRKTQSGMFANMPMAQRMGR
jgi:Membrane-fusion protein